MKILRLVIQHFGNQREKIIDFSEGTNVIISSTQETEETIQKFMNGMLFDLSAEERKKYRPRRLPFSGTLFFEGDEGEQYQINRNFLNNTFKVTDVDGNDVTEDFTDEFGNLSVFPVEDSIIAADSYDIPDISVKDSDRLKSLNAKKEELAKRFDIQSLEEERDRITKKINRLYKLQAEHHITVKARNDDHEKIIGEDKVREAELTRQIENLVSEVKSVEDQIAELKEKSEKQGAVKGQLLKRDVRNTDQRISMVENKIHSLEEEKDLYRVKLSELKSQFTYDRNTLKNDYNEYQQELERNDKSKAPEPLVSKLIGYSTWLYSFLIICGIAAILFSLYNPNDMLAKPPIFLITFLSVFIVLSSITIIYLQFRNAQAVPVGNIVPSGDTRNMALIFKKYNTSSNEEFEQFFNDAKKVFTRMDDLEADLKDINSEIADARQELEELRSEEHDITADLDKNKEAYESTDIDEEIFELTRKRNSLSLEIEELTQSREDLQKSIQEELSKRSSSGDDELSQEEKQESIGELYNKKDKIDRKINQYYSKVRKIDQRIEHIEQDSLSNRLDYINSFATPGQSDYDEKIARQFGFGLQRNLKEHESVPLITFSPFSDSENLTSTLMEKFKLFIEDNQTLIFTTDYRDLDNLRAYKIKYNGIYIK